jgi:hypothetical protein
VDGDGDLDAFVTASIYTKLYFNQGGVFVDSGEYFGSALLKDVALGDLDGDLDLDAFVANSNGANSLFVNQGGAQGGTLGDFSGDGNSYSNRPSYRVSLGDVDSDGDLDIVVANFQQSEAIWVNQGGQQGGNEGVFVQGQLFIDYDNDSYDIALGDLDGDNDLDIFFANYQQPNQVWLNDGNGTFSDSGERISTLESRGVALADVDGDNDLDAVVVNCGPSDQVYLNDGSGGFNQVQGMDNLYSYSLALADLDDNGAPDVFIANQLQNRVWTAANRWESVDPPPNTHDAPIDTHLKATTNSVYDPDTVLTSTFVVNSEYLGHVIGHIPVMLNSTPSQLNPDLGYAWFYPDEDFFPGELVEATLTGDITDHDGKSYAPYTWQFRTQVTTGSGIFSDTLQSLGSALSHGVDLADLDEDGDLDAFVVNGTDQEEQVWLNAGGVQGGTPGQFIPGPSFGGDICRDVAIGDLNADNLPDAYVAKDGANYVFKNLGAGNFYLNDSVGNSDSRAAALGDLDSDGDLDAFVANNHANKISWNIGSGFFSTSFIDLGDENSVNVVLGDINNDGDLDALVGNLGINNLWVNDGTGGFTSHALGSIWRLSYGISLGDLNGDSYLDAFIGNYGDTNEVWLNDGTGTLTITQSLGDMSPTYAVTLGDLDGDSDLDAFIANYDQPNEIWLNDGNGLFMNSGQALGSAYSEDVALGDLDLDGDMDAIVANLASTNTVWENITIEPDYYNIYLPFTVR